MTALSFDTRGGFVDRAAVGIGRALTAWGTRHAALRPAPSYSSQAARFDRSRDEASRLLPQLPR
ncbi:hypothetical protein [Leifsonia sp. NPDC058230]|uniref:hypothetical protein n=1 Tax=Leifsonia sp. NPDC058230 TaxID=3346391 RepID=UPI0036DCEFC4